VRTVLAQLLAGLLIFCPILCGAEEFGRGAQLHKHAEPLSAPAHCAADGDNCICQGAVASDNVRVSAAEAFGVPALLAALPCTPPQPRAHRGPQGSPTGLAGGGGSRAVCTFLQNFRC
jgi:hypothetical protein